jgi:superfamily II RNA helicase
MATSEGRMFQVDVIVLDEVHYLSDISRGTVWEETVCCCIFSHIYHLSCVFMLLI